MSDPRFCPQCGTARTAGGRFCGHCGAPLTDASPAPATSPEDAAHPLPSPPGHSPTLPPASEEAIAWQNDVPVLGNRLMRAGLVRGCLLTVLICGGGLGGILGVASGDVATGLIAAGLGAAATLALFGCGVLGFLIIVGFRQPIAYRLDAGGARMVNASRAAKGVHRAALITGLLTGKSAGIAAGVGAMAGETRSCAWADVKTVEDHPADCALVVRGGLLSTLQVFCTPENYAQVRAFIYARTEHAAKR